MVIRIQDASTAGGQARRARGATPRARDGSEEHPSSQMKPRVQESPSHAVRHCGCFF